MITTPLCRLVLGCALTVLLAAGELQAQTLPPPPISPAPVVGYQYDANSNLKSQTLAPGASGFAFTTSNTYDALNRRKDTTDPKFGVTRFEYTGRDDLIKVTDPRTLITQYPRNGLGDVTSLLSPDTGTVPLITYDEAGNLKTRTDSRGVLETLTYDATNRKTQLVYSKSGSTSLTYTWTYDQTGAGFANGIGRLTSTTHPTGSTQYTYDPQGRVLTDIQRVNAAPGANTAQSMTVTYTYDTAGHVSSIVYPSGRKLVIGYVGGLPVTVTLARTSTATPTTLISQIAFDPFGGAKSWLWQMAGSTQAYDRERDTSGRLVRYRMGNSLRDITYDAADRITAYTHYDASTGAATPALDQSFGYDELGRITGITTASAVWTIGYDANGNRTSVILGGVTRNYVTAAASNRLSRLTNPIRLFGYDDAGNTTNDGGNYTSTYDLAGRLATLTKAGATSTFSVDGMGRRVRKFISSGTGAGPASTVIFVYDQQGQLLGEYSSTGAALREYVWLGSTPIAVFMTDPVNPIIAPPLVYYIHTDHLDTPRVVVDKNNALRWRWLAEPFGTTAPETNPAGLGVFTQNLRFPGQYADQETGLFYNYFRDYDPTTGRYAQSDPLGLQGGINTYAYVSGNPISSTDPKGLLKETPGGNGGGGKRYCPLVAEIPMGPMFFAQITAWYCFYDCNQTCPGDPNKVVADIQWQWYPDFGCKKEIPAPQ